MGFTIIEGNIKQQMLPFLLRPGSALNKDGDGYRNSDPQYFTFRNKDTYMISGKGKLNFCPQTMKDNFDKDISYRLSYKYNSNNNPKPTDQVTYNSILENLPAIQIREYLPDTALEQSINFFVSLIKEIMSMFGDEGMSKDIKDATDTKPKKEAQQAQPKDANNQSEKSKSTDEASDNIFQRLWNVTWFVMKYVAGVGDRSLPNAATARYDTFNCTFNPAAPHYSQVLKFPHMLYYRLQSCTTTGIYELPCMKQDKRLYSSDGAPGWNMDEHSGFRFWPKSLQSLPFVGPLLGKMFGNIGISWTPWWDASTGNGTIEPPVEVTFDLFNDTNEAALINFIFVNTIVPNNKWIQYGLFQHSSHIYDIKIEGYNRLFACTGAFEVAYDGVLRDPPPNWYKSDGPLAAHINENLNKDAFLTSLYANKLIKIPDVYKVKLTFNSLLPANFNNYLYTLVMNDNHIDHNAYWYKTRDKSQLGPAMTNAFTSLLSGAVDAFGKGKKQNHVPKGMKL